MTTIDDVRTAHMTEGPTFASYINASSILTAGADGNVNVYPALYDDESLSVSLASKISSLAVKGECVVLSNEKNEVKSYSLPDMKLMNTLLRFTGAVNCVCISDDQNIVVAGSSDFLIKTVHTDGSDQRTYTGHTAPILCTKFTASRQLISTSCDGTLKVWNVSDQKCMKTLNILPTSNSPSKCPGVLSISESLKRVAVPSGDVVKIISMESWTEDYVLGDGHKESISNVCWSPSGRYLVTSSNVGEIICWDVVSRKSIKRYQHQESKGITSLEWKKSTEVLFADEEGEFGMCEMPADEESGNKNTDFDVDDDDEILATALMDGDDDGTNDGDIFLSSAAKKSKKRLRPTDIDDDDEVVEDDASSKRTRINNMDNFLDDQADEDDDDDEASVSLNLIKEGLMEPIRRAAIVEDEDDPVPDIPTEKMKPPVAAVDILMQPPFQPSSTPIHLQHRFMVWNAIGIVRCHRDDGVSSIDVEFHNASTSHPLHIANVLENEMAVLSNTAVVLACKKQDDMPSKLTCMHFGSWDNNKEWNLSMTEDEDIMSISVNNTHVAVATSRGLLRLLSVGGLQTQLLYLPGRVVSIAMHDKEIMVVYHRSTGHNKCQCLGVVLYQNKKSTWKMTTDDVLNLQCNVTVTWIGYSTEGNPAIVLSSGEVLLLHRSQQSWTVVGNTKDQVKKKSDNYWVIGIEERQAQMRCIYCKAANFPALLPRPIPTFIGFQFPLCEINTEKSKKEHELIRNKVMLSNMRYSEETLRLPIVYNSDTSQKQQIQLLIQLFALACKSDRDFRAVEICKLMPSSEAVGLAIQYASKMRKMNVAKRLTELAQSMAAQEEEDEEENEQEVDSEIEDDFAVDDDEDEFSDGAAMFDKAGVVNSTPAAPKRSSKLNIGRHRNTATAAANAEDKYASENEKENSEDEKNVDEEDSEDFLKFSQTSLQPSSQSQNSSATPKPRLTGNPFKVSGKDNSQEKSTTAKGTTYFETLKSQKLSKTKQVTKTINNVVKKKQNKISTKSLHKPEKKKDVESTKENIDFNVVDKEQKRLTGFQLFLNKQRETAISSHEDDFVPIAMRMWKELPADQKKDWNNRAKEDTTAQKTTKDITNSAKQQLNTENGKVESKNTSAKNKLSSFAFQNT